MIELAFSSQSMVIPVVDLRYRFYLPLNAALCLQEIHAQRMRDLFFDVCTAWGVNLLSVSAVGEFVKIETSGSIPLQLSNFVGNIKDVSEHFVLNEFPDLAPTRASDRSEGWSIWGGGFAVTSVATGEQEAQLLGRLRAQPISR